MPYGVNVRSLKAYRTAKKANERIDAVTIKKWRLKLRDAFKFYLVDRGRKSATMTDIRNSISKICKIAKRFVESPTWVLANELLGLLETDPSVEAIVRQSIHVAGDEWVNFKQEIRWQIATNAFLDVVPTAVGEPGGRPMEIVRYIARLDVTALALKSGRWRDPALFQLVCHLMPLWEEITGRTAAQSTDRIEQTKVFPFAAWLEEMHKLFIFEAPRTASVNDIVLFLKSKNRQHEKIRSL